MKRINKTLVLISSFIVLFSCEAPLEDTLKEINEDVAAFEKQKEEDALNNGTEEIDTILTFTQEDYNKIKLEENDDIERFSGFETFEQAEQLIPDILAEKFLPQALDQSKASVIFNLFNGNPKEFNSFPTAEITELEDADYPTVNSNAFLPNENPQNEIPSILASKITGAVKDQVARVKYLQYTEEPTVTSTLVPIATFNFQNSFENWQNIDLLDTDFGWTTRDDFINASGFRSGSANPSEDWLVSPEIDLTGQEGVIFQIRQLINFLSGQNQLVRILITTSYTGDVTTTSWDEINLETAPPGNNFNFVTSEEFNLTDYEGNKIHIALQYTSTNSIAPLWRVENIEIRPKDSVNTFSGATEESELFFTFDGTEWRLNEDILLLTAEDYDSMGEENGPGRFNNFSSSTRPENYLPQFLNLRLPFAQEGDSFFVIYVFSFPSIGDEIPRLNKTTGNTYTFIDGVWSPATSTSVFRVVNRVWIADNAIEYTFDTEDYDAVVNEFRSVSDLGDEVSNLDNFGNFNRGDRSTSWDDDEIGPALGFIVNQKFPDENAGKAFLVTVEIFNGSRTTETIRIVKKEDGSFEIP